MKLWGHAAALLILWGSGLPVGQATLTTVCAERLHPILRFDPRLIPRIAPENPITPGLANAAMVLNRLTQTGGEEFSGVRPACQTQSIEVRLGLEAVIRSRFLLLLRQDRLEEFYEEFRNLRAPFQDERLRRFLEAFLAAFKAETRYLSAVGNRLAQRMAATPDPLWQRIHGMIINHRVSAEAWSPWPWTQVTGRDSPAAYLYHEHRLAAQAFEFSPFDLEILLFHELIHLQDPEWEGRRVAIDGVTFTEIESRHFAREAYAWDETARYYDWILGQGLVPPPGSPFPGVRANIRVLGALRFVRFVWQGW